MSRLIRLDYTGHTMLAEWTAEDSAAVEAAVSAFKTELEQGYYAVVSDCDGRASHVRQLPIDASLVILRQPIAGG